MDVDHLFDVRGCSVFRLLPVHTNYPAAGTLFWLGNSLVLLGFSLTGAGRAPKSQSAESSAAGKLFFMALVWESTLLVAEDYGPSLGTPSIIFSTWAFAGSGRRRRMVVMCVLSLLNEDC